MFKMNYNKCTNLVNCSSDKYMRVNNCGVQTRTGNFTVTRNDGWRDYHILYIVSGKCIVFHNGKEHTLLSGGIVLYAPGEAQKYIFPSECVSLWIHFSGTAVREILKECSLKSGVYQLTPDTYLDELFYRLINHFNREKTRKYSNALIIEMLYCISDKIQNPDFPKYSDSICAVTSYINKNYDRKFTLDELAKISGYSKSRFSYLFKQFTGYTPTEYQRNIRLNSSCDLLCSTQLSVEEVAFKCGYDDAIYFSKLFKKKYGVSPTQYKNVYYKNG